MRSSPHKLRRRLASRMAHRAFGDCQNWPDQKHFFAPRPSRCLSTPASRIAVLAPRKSPHSSSKSALRPRGRRVARPLRKRSARNRITNRLPSMSSTPSERPETGKPSDRARAQSRRRGRRRRLPRGARPRERHLRNRSISRLTTVLVAPRCIAVEMK